MPINPNTAEPMKPHRRWFQFRLRTLLVGMALLGAACGYVAHEVKIVEARKAWLRNHVADIRSPSIREEIRWLEGNPAEKPSLIRRWLGDVDCSSDNIMFAYQYVILPNDASQAEIDEVRLLFPEALIGVEKPWLLKS
jgi:hypothetical protein